MAKTHSTKFDMVYTYYNTFINGQRIWSIDRVRNAVVKKLITKAEFKEITGEEYSA